METYNTNTSTSGTQPGKITSDPNRNGRIFGGIFIVVVGLILLARQAGAEIPRWLFSFESILIGVGLYIGIRQSFRGVAWLIPTLVGVFFLFDDFYPEIDIENFIWPIIIIAIGLFMIFRGGKKKSDWRAWEREHARSGDLADDFLDSTVVFGGVKKNIISKDFKGGEAVTVFGGTEINLMQADLTGPVVLELTQVFGGTKLIVPPHWKIQSKDMVAILGGIDDKRPMLGKPQGEEGERVLILKGTCLLGGIDIRSF
jgi:hypothetical protein